MEELRSIWKTVVRNRQWYLCTPTHGAVWEWVQWAGNLRDQVSKNILQLVMLQSSPVGGLGFSLEEKWDKRSWVWSEGGGKGWAVHYGMVPGHQTQISGLNPRWRGNQLCSHDRIYKIMEISDGRKYDIFLPSSLFTPMRRLDGKYNGQDVYSWLISRDNSLIQSKPLTLLGSISSFLALK